MHTYYHRTITITTETLELKGSLRIPPGAREMIIMPIDLTYEAMTDRQRAMVEVFDQHGYATLLVSMVNTHATAALHQFEMPIIAERITVVMHYLKQYDRTQTLRMGVYAEEVCAAAALFALTNHPHTISAIVCNQAPLYLLENSLNKLTVPSRFLIRASDLLVKQTEQQIPNIPAKTDIELVDTDDPEEEAELAVSWFERHLRNQ